MGELSMKEVRREIDRKLRRLEAEIDAVKAFVNMPVDGDDDDDGEDANTDPQRGGSVS